MRKPTMILAMSFALASATLIGCPATEVTPCVSGADCASGVCNLDGTCGPVGPDLTFPTEDGAGDANPPETANNDGASELGPGPDTANDIGQDPGVDVPTGACTFNNDGRIDRTEIPLAAGQHATYRVAQDVTVDTGGADVDGVTQWDFSGSFSGDQDVLVEAVDPSAWWFAESFPGATYVARLSQSDDLLGIFKLTDDALQLLGVASPEGGFLKTELSYDPPVDILQFPLEVGKSWSTSSTVTGFTSGVVSYLTESYEVEVDKAGEVVTPFSTFDVLRVATSMNRLVGVTPYSERQLSFVSECFGVVAAARSEAYATQVDFGDAAELRRLAP